MALNAQHHQLKVLKRRTVPGPFEVPKMKYYTDYIAKLESLPVINPGTGEYVHVMEGQRKGYNNLTILSPHHAGQKNGIQLDDTRCFVPILFSARIFFSIWPFLFSRASLW